MEELLDDTCGGRDKRERDPSGSSFYSFYLPNFPSTLIKLCAVQDFDLSLSLASRVKPDFMCSPHPFIMMMSIETDGVGGYSLCFILMMLADGDPDEEDLRGRTFGSIDRRRR